MRRGSRIVQWPAFIKQKVVEPLMLGLRQNDLHLHCLARQIEMEAVGLAGQAPHFRDSWQSLGCWFLHPHILGTLHLDLPDDPYRRIPSLQKMRQVSLTTGWVGQLPMSPWIPDSPFLGQLHVSPKPL
jgi:hypothetical protein